MRINAAIVLFTRSFLNPSAVADQWGLKSLWFISSGIVNSVMK